MELSAADEQLLRELTERARTGGLKLTGEGGLWGKLTKMVDEIALEGEMDGHLGYAKNDRAAATAATRATAIAAGPCSPRPGRWKSRCHAIAIPPSSRKSSAKGSGG